MTAPDHNTPMPAARHKAPYPATRETLYSTQELYAGYDAADESTRDQCYDAKVYRHYISTGKHAGTEQEAKRRALHDHAIRQALNRFLKGRDPKKSVGIMGGHAVLRTDAMFRQIALLSKTLTEKGFLMMSGGGPGAMEATHLGAWLAGRTQKETEDAFQILSASPSFEDPGWLSTAYRVMEKYPRGPYESLSIPTWLYGHEPSAAFASHIAKFFENSLREDGLLTFAFGGIIYSPGSAGTLQEIFQDAAQNHYLSFGFASPMIFLGRKFWTEDVPVYPFLKGLQDKGRYKNLPLSIHDDSEEIVKELMAFGNR